MPREAITEDHPKDIEIHKKIMHLANSTKTRKKKSLSRILEKYGIDVSYGSHMILSTLVIFDDYIGVRACIELGGNPELIMDNKLIPTMRSVQMIRFDGIFRSFGYNCVWWCGHIEEIIRFHEDSESSVSSSE